MFKDKLLIYLGIMGFVGTVFVVSNIYLTERKTNIYPPNFKNISNDQLEILKETVLNNIQDLYDENKNLNIENSLYDASNIEDKGNN